MYYHCSLFYAAFGKRVRNNQVGLGVVMEYGFFLALERRAESKYADIYPFHLLLGLCKFGFTSAFSCSHLLYRNAGIYLYVKPPCLNMYPSWVLFRSHILTLV